MKNLVKFGTTVLCGALVTAASTSGGGKEYQVTGPISELTPTSITVMKGEKPWLLSRNSGTTVSGGTLAVGTKVTIYYTMTATEIDVKPASKAKSSEK